MPVIFLLATSLGGCNSSSAPQSGADLINDGTPGEQTGNDNMEGSEGGTTTPGSDIDSDGDADTISEADQLGLFQPTLSDGSDLDRLFKGIKRHVSLTLLGLNDRFSQGEYLTTQQKTCIGTYNPADGRQLTSISCEIGIGTKDDRVTIVEAGFFDIDSCQADLHAGNADSCVLERAQLSIPTEWASQNNTGEIPRPIEGSEIFYLTEDKVLRLEHSSSFPGPACDLNLADDSDLSDQVATEACSELINIAADRLDETLPADTVIVN